MEDRMTNLFLNFKSDCGNRISVFNYTIYIDCKAIFRPFRLNTFAVHHFTKSSQQHLKQNSLSYSRHL